MNYLAGKYYVFNRSYNRIISIIDVMMTFFVHGMVQKRKFKQFSITTQSTNNKIQTFNHL